MLHIQGVAGLRVPQPVIQRAACCHVVSAPPCAASGRVKAGASKSTYSKTRKGVRSANTKATLLQFSIGNALQPARTAQPDRPVHWATSPGVRHGRADPLRAAHQPMSNNGDNVNIYVLRQHQRARVCEAARLCVEVDARGDSVVAAGPHRASGCAG